MGLIIIADSLYFRHAGIYHILMQKGHPLSDIVDLSDLRNLYLFRRHDSVLIIGNRALSEDRRISKAVSQYNINATIRRILFSDVIGQYRLTKYLVIDNDNVIVPSDLSIPNLLDLSDAWLNGFSTKSQTHLSFNKVESEMLKYIEHSVLNIVVYKKSNCSNSQRLAINRLKRKVHIRSEYTLCLLWVLFNKILTLS